MAMKNIFKELFGTGDENEGFVDYEDGGYDTSSSAVTEQEADYSQSYGSGYSSLNSNSSYSSSNSSSKVINFAGSSNQSKFAVLYPKSVEEVMSEGISFLRNGTIVVFNLEEIDQDSGARIVDFMTGAVAMCEGRISKINGRCFAAAPKNVEWVKDINDYK